LLRHPKQVLEFRNGRVFWSWSGEGVEVDEPTLSRSHWSLRLPLVKDGVEWGWLNFYRSLDDETLLVTTNYLSDLFRREFTEAASRIFTVHEQPLAKAAMAVGDRGLTRISAD